MHRIATTSKRIQNCESALQQIDSKIGSIGFHELPWATQQAFRIKKIRLQAQINELYEEVYASIGKNTDM